MKVSVSGSDFNKMEGGIGGNILKSDISRFSYYAGHFFHEFLPNYEENYHNNKPDQ
jgi:hypothetical protein